MIDNIPRSVQKCVSASARDIVAAMKETGSAKGRDLESLAATMEKFMLGMVGPAFPSTKGAWVDRTAAPVAPDEASAVKVKQEKEVFRNWVKENATKEMYETHIGAVDSLANVLRQQYDNDETGQFAKNFPELVGMLESGAAPAPMSTDKPAAMPEPSKDIPPLEKSDKDSEGIPGDLSELINDRLEDAGSDIPKEEKSKGKDKEPEESPEGYTGGIFDKPKKGPAPAGEPTPKHQNMDEFNTPVEKLAEEKPEAATGHKI